MNLIAPQNLGFAALMGAILLLYVLRLKRRERTVASTLLWQESLRDLQANAPWQKLRSSLLMWLQLGVVALAVFALSRPAIQVLSGGGQTIAIVLDASASMQATDVSPSRFEKAREEARRLIGALGTGDQGAIIVAGRTTQVLAPLTRDKNVLNRALSQAQTQDARSDLREAIVLASSLLQGKKPSQIVVLSDGAIAPITAPPTGAAALQWVRVGTRNDNLAITAMDAARPYTRGGRPQIFVTIANYSPRQRAVDLELQRNGALIAVRNVAIPAAQKDAPGTRAELFENLRFDDGTFQARFVEKDDLAADNFAYATLDAPRQVQVLLLSAGNVFLEKALALDGNVRLTRGTAADFAQSATRFDVVVCDNVAPPANLQSANLLVFRALSAAMPVERVGAGDIAQPNIVDWQRRHPVTRAASWNDLKIAQSVRVKTKSWGEAIVEAVETPLVVAGTRRIDDARGARQQRVVWCGFDVRDSDLPLRVTFPIFITNAVRWLADNGQNRIDNAARRPGTPIALPLPNDAAAVAITDPAGNTQQLTVTRRPFTYDAATRAGLYEAQSSNWKYSFGLSLLDKNESDLQPRDALRSATGTTLTAQNRARANRELWSWFALAALGLLAVEWWIFHRGV